MLLHHRLHELAEARGVEREHVLGGRLSALPSAEALGRRIGWHLYIAATKRMGDTGG